MTERQIAERNQHYLIVEVVWAAIFTGCVSFNAAYLIRLGGSNLLVSLLSSGAALINAIAALPFAAFLERRARRKPWIVGSLALVRLGHLGLIAIPWLTSWRPAIMRLSHRTRAKRSPHSGTASRRQQAGEDSLSFFSGHAI